MFFKESISFKMNFNVKYSNILFIVYLHTCKCKNLVKMVSTLEELYSNPTFAFWLFYNYLLPDCINGQYFRCSHSLSLFVLNVDLNILINAPKSWLPFSLFLQNKWINGVNMFVNITNSWLLLLQKQMNKMTL